MRIKIVTPTGEHYIDLADSVNPLKYDINQYSEEIMECGK